MKYVFRWGAKTKTKTKEKSVNDDTYLPTK